MLTEAFYQFPILHKKGSVVASLRNALRTALQLLVSDARFP